MPLFYLVLIAAILLGFIIGVGVVRRLQDTGLTMGIVIAAFITFVTTFAAIALFGLLANLNAQMFYPKYTATIIDYDSRWETDPDGPDRLMHRAILQFTDKSGQEIIQKSGQASTTPPAIGDTVEIYFKNGQLYQPHPIMYLGVGVFVFTFGYIATYAAFYAAHWNRDRLDRVGVIAFLYILIPAALVAMMASLLYIVFDYLWGSNQAEISSIAAIFAGVMIAVVFAALNRYIHHLRKRERPSADPK